MARARGSKQSETPEKGPASDTETPETTAAETTPEPEELVVDARAAEPPAETPDAPPEVEATPEPIADPEPPRRS